MIVPASASISKTWCPTTSRPKSSSRRTSSPRPAGSSTAHPALSERSASGRAMACGPASLSARAWAMGSAATMCSAARELEISRMDHGFVHRAASVEGSERPGGRRRMGGRPPHQVGKIPMDPDGILLCRGEGERADEGPGGTCRRPLAPPSAGGCAAVTVRTKSWEEMGGVAPRDGARAVGRNIRWVRNQDLVPAGAQADRLAAIRSHPAALEGRHDPAVDLEGCPVVVGPGKMGRLRDPAPDLGEQGNPLGEGAVGSDVSRRHVRLDRQVPGASRRGPHAFGSAGRAGAAPSRGSAAVCHSAPARRAAPATARARAQRESAS